MTTFYHATQLPLFPSKACVKCGKEKLLSQFYKASKGKDGYRTDCKECVRRDRQEYYQEYYRARREQFRQRNIEYRVTHQEQIQQQQRKKYIAHQKEYQEYRDTHPELFQQRNRAWRQSNPLKDVERTRRRYAR